MAASCMPAGQKITGVWLHGTQTARGHDYSKPVGGLGCNPSSAKSLFFPAPSLQLVTRHTYKRLHGLAGELHAVCLSAINATRHAPQPHRREQHAYNAGVATPAGEHERCAAAHIPPVNICGGAVTMRLSLFWMHVGDLLMVGGGCAMGGGAGP